MIKKDKKIVKLYIILIIIFLLILIIIYINDIYNNYEEYIKNKVDKFNYKKINDLTSKEQINSYKTNKFAIIRRLECPNCGFFSFYIVHLGCINKYLLNGFIPIVDLKSFNNSYNKGNTSIFNPWELFFYQPFNYTLDETKTKAKNIKYLKCTGHFYRPDELNIFYDKKSRSFWHEFANKYMPINDILMNEANIIMKKLFNNSKNILGVKLRGTDYLSAKPKMHSIQPKVEKVIFDVKMMDKLYNYKYIFFSTEDELIKEKFKIKFKDKLRLLNPNVKIEYEYIKKETINLNTNIYGNIEYIKNYVLNIIILSKCLDIVVTRCSGSVGIFILTNGFRHIKIYNLGLYK